MKDIRIKSIALLNFKGIRDLKVDFYEDLTTISGRNGLGKTTIFDAFTYVLFGKDSHDRKDFDIKTLGPDGKVIERIPHEVTAELLVSGQEVTLRRCYVEKWTKKRGAAEEVFTGHEEERYFNGVPCSAREYAAKVAEICDESVFKFTTNPLYFTAQKTDVQRAMLFRMAGGVSNEEVAGDRREFRELLAKLTGKNLEEYRRELAAKRKKVKEAVEFIPARIDERRRDMPETEDWKALEARKETLLKEMDALDASLSDISKRAAARNGERKKDADALSAVLTRIYERKAVIQERELKGYYAEKREQEEASERLVSLRKDVERIREKISARGAYVEDLNRQRAALLAEWKEIGTQQLSFGEGDFVCPTCGRTLDMDAIEQKRGAMTERFNADKAKRLEDNKAAGMAVRSKIDEAMADVRALEGMLAEKERLCGEVADLPILGKRIVMPETGSAVENDMEYMSLRAEEESIRKRMAEAPGAVEDTAEIKRRKADIVGEVSDIDARLGRRETIRMNEKRISELEEDLRKLSQELTGLEGEEFTIQQFCRARVEAIEGRVNAMFSEVRFKMFETQINGGEVETCEATVNGVPFSSLNNAGRINAGLDIINAICRFEGVRVPCFIDNAEAVNKVRGTESQMVRLVVSDENELTVW